MAFDCICDMGAASLAFLERLSVSSPGPRRRVLVACDAVRLCVFYSDAAQPQHRDSELVSLGLGYRLFGVQSGGGSFVIFRREHIQETT